MSGNPPHGKHSARERLKVFGPATFLTLVGFLVAYQFVEPAPPEQITIATGSEEGAYFGFAQRYRRVLARHGIRLEIVTTAGSVENIELLENGERGVEVAFVQGGTGDPESTQGLSSLASIYFEPLWVFHRRERQVLQLRDLRGLKVAVGPAGSGTRAVALQLLEANGILSQQPLLTDLGGARAAAALARGEIDAALFVLSAEVPLISDLLHNPDVELMGFERGESYTRVYPFLSTAVLLRGVIDFEADVPHRDVKLVAPAATLVVHEDIHPALIDLLLQAAGEVHGRGGLLEAPGQFPSPRYLDFPLHREAERFFRSGPPLLQRYLPFWAATLVDRLKVMLLPLLTLLFPLMKIVPPTYRWKVRSRIYRWYRELEKVDLHIGGCRTDEELDARALELDRIEAEVTQVSVPLSYAVELYDLRLHIAHVRQKLQDARPAP